MGGARQPIRPTDVVLVAEALAVGYHCYTPGYGGGWCPSCYVADEAWYSTPFA